jgi:hypothetical protein
MENLTPNENDVLNAINANPGIGAGQLGRMLGLDRNYARRVADRLIGFGLATKRGNGQGFVYFGNGTGRFDSVSNGSAPVNPSTYSPSTHAEPLEGSFVDVTPGAPFRNTGNPNEASRAVAVASRHNNGVTLPAALAAMLNGQYNADPFGDEVAYQPATHSKVSGATILAARRTWMNCTKNFMTTTSCCVG